MRLVLIIMLFLALPFTGSFYGGKFSNSCTLKAQQEELEEMKEEPSKKEAPKKEESKTEEKKEIKKNQQQEEELKDEVKEELSETEKYYREKYEEVYTAPFETVWNAVKKSIGDIGCMIASEKYSQNEQGLFKGTIKSDFCVFVQGRDSTLLMLKRYSKDLPFIRGGIWINGRITYTCKLKEETDGKVSMVMTTQMSGFEDYITHEVNFWKSNGLLERDFLTSIKKNLNNKN